MRIGILNGGGDCAGLNAVTRAVVKHAEELGWEVLGIRYGWEGLLKLDDSTKKLTYRDMENIVSMGGTILKSSRTNPTKRPKGLETIVENSNKLGLDAVIAVGGDDTLGVAAKLYKIGLRIVGVPKTIDNDLSGTDFTFGFDSAINEAVRAIDNLKTTAESHDRVFIVEVMGREAGWIAAYAGIASGANLVIVPEEPFDVEEVATFVRNRHETGKRATIIVVSEGAKLKNLKGVDQGAVDEFGHVRLGGIGQFLETEIEKKTKYDVRLAVLGHMIRGGSPSAFDRVLSTRFGIAAVELIRNGKFGMMVSLKDTKISEVSLEESTSKPRLLDPEISDVARMMSY